MLVISSSLLAYAMPTKLVHECPLDHHLLTMAPFISLNTTPLKIIGEFGSDRSSGSKRQPSCLDQNSSIITQLFIMILQPHVRVGDQSVLKWHFLLI